MNLAAGALKKKSREISWDLQLNVECFKLESA